MVLLSAQDVQVGAGCAGRRPKWHPVRRPGGGGQGRRRLPARARMIPYSDGIAPRRFPVVNVALIVANFAVFLFYELPNGEAAVNQASFYPCDVNNSCHLGVPWGVGWITAMFMHAGWDHILGNMLFLAIFGKNVEDAFGRLGYLLFYFAGGFAAMMLQTAMTLVRHRGRRADTQPGRQRRDRRRAGRLFRALSRLTHPHAPGVVPDQHPAWVFLGGWFLYQFFESNYALIHPSNTGDSGVAFFAHVGGFIFGAVVARVLLSSGRITAQAV